MSIPRRELFEVWRQQSELSNKNQAVILYVYERLGISVDSDPEQYNLADIKTQINNFNSAVAQKWTKAQRSLKVFLPRESAWLDVKITFSITSNPGTSKSTTGTGRPTKEFTDLTPSSKKRKMKPLVETYSKEELTFAAQHTLRLSGQRDAANILREVTETSPKRATQIKKAWKSPTKEPVKYSPEEALALFVDGRFTKHSYNLMRFGAKNHNANIYPTYDIIVKAKKDCYPSIDTVTVTEISAEVTLQGIVNHTVTRLALFQRDVLIQYVKDLEDGLTMIFKWGCDGSSGHSSYKQKFAEGTSTTQADSSLFAICLVPLCLKAKKTGALIWHNSKPSSTRFCRPIKLLFEKETADLSRREIRNIQQQIDVLLPTTITVADQEIVVVSDFKLTMIDGKIFSVISNVSSQVCGICGASPKFMNDLDRIYQRTSDEAQYDYGLSTLHAWIRCFECMLHIAYRLDIQKWQVSTEADKDKFKSAKTRIQNELREKMGLLVDIPKPGYGTTNDGNTASRFFEHSALAASITQIDEDLIKRFGVILQTISCGYTVNVEAFRSYIRTTAEKYVHLYSWYYMPSSVHKLLIHGADIIEAAVLPIGMFSEEALEARNKDFRRYREFHTRKFTRLQTMTDLFNRLLVSSDPYISSLSKTNNLVRTYSTKTLDSEVRALLVQPFISTDDSENDNSSDSEHE